MHYLARLYTEGLGVEINAKEALQWIVKAADAGYVPSMIHLGRSYEAARSRDEAIKWFRKAAEAGSADAKARLERLLSQK
jgi:uncharacterized protein